MKTEKQIRKRVAEVDKMMMDISQSGDFMSAPMIDAQRYALQWVLEEL